jgi:hypothetical protein
MTSEESEVTESVSEPGVTNPRRHRRRHSRNYIVKKLYDRFKPFVARSNKYKNTHCHNIYVKHWYSMHSTVYNTYGEDI